MIGTRDKTLEKSSRWHKGKEIMRETVCRSGGISGIGGTLDGNSGGTITRTDITIVDKAV